MLSCSSIFINIRWVDASSIFVVCIGTWALISCSLILIYIGWAHPSCIYIRTPWNNWLHYNLLTCNLPSNACIDHIGYRKEQQFACVRLRRWMTMIFFSKSYEPYRYRFCLTDETTSSVTACCHPSTKPPLLLPITRACVHNLVIDVCQSQYVSSISYILTITSSNFLYYPWPFICTSSLY
jgi:hypothetical protein